MYLFSAHVHSSKWLYALSKFAPDLFLWALLPLTMSVLNHYIEGARSGLLMNNQKAEYLYNGMLFTMKKHGCSSNMNEPHKHYAK